MTATFTAGQTLTAVQTNTDLANPTGMLAPFAGSTQPTGWLLCDGTSKTSAAYPDLFAVIGYTYGGSAGTFYLPDMRGRVPMGAGTGTGGGIAGGPSAAPAGGVALTPRALGAYDGDERLHAHSHVATESAHTHSPNGQANFLTWDGGSLGGQSGGGLPVPTGSPGTTGSTAATVTVSNNTQGGLRQNVQPVVVLNYIIKT